MSGAELVAQDAAARVVSIVDRVAAALDHVVTELSAGDRATWAAFGAVVLAAALIVGLWRGSIRIGKG